MSSSILKSSQVEILLRGDDVDHAVEVVLLDTLNGSANVSGQV
jgi:hypothetical protein